MSCLFSMIILQVASALTVTFSVAVNHSPGLLCRSLIDGGCAARKLLCPSCGLQYTIDMQHLVDF